MLNDYSITNDGNATTRYLQIIQLLKDRNLIDLVGVQAHAFEFNYNNLDASAATHRANLRGLRRAGCRCTPRSSTSTVSTRCSAFRTITSSCSATRRLFPVFWEKTAVKGITMWGYVQGAHWRTNQGAWLMYPNGAERPALQWLVRYVENNLPTVNPGQAFTVNENLAPGSAIGTVHRDGHRYRADAVAVAAHRCQRQVRDRSGNGGDQPRGRRIVWISSRRRATR